MSVRKKAGFMPDQPSDTHELAFSGRPSGRRGYGHVHSMATPLHWCRVIHLMLMDCCTRWWN